MSGFIWIAGPLAVMAATVATAIKGLIVASKSIETLRSFVEQYGQYGTPEAKTLAIAIGRMVTRIAVERRTDVRQWRGLIIRAQSRGQASDRTPDPH